MAYGIGGINWADAWDIERGNGADAEASNLAVGLILEGVCVLCYMSIVVTIDLSDLISAITWVSYVIHVFGRKIETGIGSIAEITRVVVTVNQIDISTYPSTIYL